MKWIFKAIFVVAIWPIICVFKTIGFFGLMIAYLVCIIALHLWDLKLHKYKWSNFTNTASSDYYSTSNGDKTPWITYINWIKYPSFE